MTETCPICFGKLNRISEESYTRIIMDGNINYQCYENKTHKFWSHPFSFNILRLTTDPSLQTWKWTKAYEYDNNGKVIAIHINEKQIGE